MERQEDFRTLKFGMFIHYNLETYKDVQWVSGYHSPADFNPGGPVDTDAWADAAKAAGMKYAVLTAKHVSGFCLWDSKYTTYGVMHPDCPYKQDLVGQFVKSFTSRGLKVGLYYCWRNPGFDKGNNGENKGKFKVLPPECDPATHSMEEQVLFQKKQIAELVEKYPEVFYIWNDGLDPEIMPDKDAQAFIRSLGSNIIACGNWWDWGRKGDPYLDLVVTETKHCKERAKESLYPAGETCWCLEKSWFCNGSGPKSAQDIVEQLQIANSRNANFLLNVGPDKAGKINADSLKVLHEIGEMRLEEAEITFDGERLVADTGRMTRSWRWTGRGFLTTEIKAGETAVWCLDHDDFRDADWLLPVVEERNPAAELVSAETVVSDDEGFTSKHVRFTAELHYAEARLAVRFEVWAYPQAPGVRVQLKVKALDGFKWDGTLDRLETTEKSLREARLGRGYQRLDILPVAFKGKRRRMIGYFSDTQNRNDRWLDILLEAEDAKPLDYPYVCEWSNALCVEDEVWGVAMVKESHKCVNQRGVDTGFFACDPVGGLESYGWGIRPSEINPEWRPAWATWCLVYASDERSRLRAFKTFDRLRYPLTERDIYIQANTWGSSQGAKQHRDAAGEENVLREIASCADLGIDVLQIDDGWQGDQLKEWRPVPPRYPDGWTAVRDAANKAGVSLGLWMAAIPPTLEDMERNIQEGGFVSLKLDFAALNTRQKIDELMDKVRALVLGRRHRLRINWDLTEVEARYGYFFAREFGCIYLENRKPVLPVSVIYRPGTVLRDLWQISRYCNLLKFQGSIQNIDMVNKRFSDAGAYNHAYSTAIALMSTPLFFCETHLYSDQARDEIRPLLAAYKQVREDIYRGLVHPIGEKPDGASWTGFECELLDEKRGFLTLFREPGNTQPNYAFRVPHLAGRALRLENLLNGERWNATVDKGGLVSFVIEAHGDFRFLAYACDKDSE